MVFEFGRQERPVVRSDFVRRAGRALGGTVVTKRSGRHDDERSAIQECVGAAVSRCHVLFFSSELTDELFDRYEWCEDRWPLTFAVIAGGAN